MSTPSRPTSSIDDIIARKAQRSANPEFKSALFAGPTTSNPNKQAKPKKKQQAQSQADNATTQEATDVQPMETDPVEAASTGTVEPVQTQAHEGDDDATDVDATVAPKTKKVKKAKKSQHGVKKTKVKGARVHMPVRHMKAATVAYKQRSRKSVKRFLAVAGVPLSTDKSKLLFARLELELIARMTKLAAEHARNNKRKTLDALDAAGACRTLRPNHRVYF